MTASRLERMRSCHFAYFMEYGLRAKPREPASFDAPQIGTFLHYLLENVTRDVLRQGGFAAVDNKELHRLTRQYIDQYAEQELHNFQNRTPRFRYLFNRLRTNAYAIIDQVAEELRHSDFVPMAFELGFGGKDGTLPAVTISRPDGELRVGGKVDRVDGWLHDGKLYLRVVDYKTGKKAFDLSDLRYGLGIQMLLYLFTLEKEGRSYFGYPIVPAGVLYHPAREVILKKDRGIQPEKLQAALQEELRRSGMVLADPEVLRAMEHSALEAPHYLPIRVKKDGSISDGIASAEQLGKLGRYVEDLLHQIAREIGSGNIDASTADTLRPALQILKTAPGTKLVSAFFVMCTDTPQFGTDGTLIFADCGLNINPSSDELSEIAIASAHSWSTFMGNVEPHVAMLSYSTMGSAGGEVAKKVQEAVKFCKEKAPELAIDGDLQLDAAIVPTVAQLKAPGSSVAGKANVLVFPDLEAGNIGYKLVQRFAGADAYGPILQGIAKPVNDLSRGCSADDIVGVVAITAVQAQMAE